jgi:hypothetical protein
MRYLSFREIGAAINRFKSNRKNTPKGSLEPVVHVHESDDNEVSCKAFRPSRIEWGGTTQD